MDTREQICEAAMRIAVRDGLLALTIDRVAQETGLSKGGVTHHFRSKNELLLAVVKHFGEFLERQLTTLVAQDTQSEFRWIRAMLEVTYPSSSRSSLAKSQPAESSGTHTIPSDSASDSGGGELSPAAGDAVASLPSEGANRMMMSILAAALHDRQLLEPIREIGQRMQRRLLDDNRGEVDQLLYWLVLDGLFVWELAGLIVPGEPLHERIVDRVRAMAGQSRSWEVTRESSFSPTSPVSSSSSPNGHALPASSAESLKETDVSTRASSPSTRRGRRSRAGGAS